MRCADVVDGRVGGDLILRLRRRRLALWILVLRKLLLV